MGEATVATRVLIVEDETIIAETLSRIFSAAGHDCRAFLSAEEFLRQEDSAWTADFALIDVMLPGIDGTQLAIYLRNTYPEMKLTLFSGHLETGEILARAEEEGYSFKILAKPVHPTELLELIHQAAPRAGQKPSESSISKLECEILPELRDDSSLAN